MEITFRCPQCQTSHSIEPDGIEGAIPCSACGSEIPLNLSESIRKQNLVDACPRCSESVFYIQRDFNQKLGLGIVIIFALIGLVFVWLGRPLYFYVSLGAGAAIDLLFYLILPEITICYACKTAFRNMQKNPDHKPFDLHIADIYDNRSMG